MEYIVEFQESKMEFQQSKSMTDVGFQQFDLVIKRYIYPPLNLYWECFYHVTHKKIYFPSYFGCIRFNLPSMRFEMLTC